MSCLSVLAACGGGGGGGSGAGATPGLTLSPNPLAVTAQEFSASTVTVNGSISNASSVPGLSSGGTAYFRVTGSDTAFDSQATFSGTVGSFTATLQTLPWLSAGTHTGTITVAACSDQLCANPISGLATSVPFTVTVNPSAQAVHRLLPSALGVALATTPQASVLSRSLSVHDNFGVATAWTATSDSAWLTVTSSGQSDSTALVITADATNLPTGQTSVATVTLASTVAGITGATIHVGLWKASSDVTGFVTLAGVDPSDIARDPWRPLVYVVDGGANVQVFNAHTASRVATISGVGTQLDAVAVSPDGARLFALDASSIKVVDLASQQVVGTWPLSNLATTFEHRLVVVRPNGQDVLLVGNGTAVVNGVAQGATGIQPGYTAAIDNGTRLYGIEEDIDPDSISSYELRWSDDNGGRFIAMQSHTLSNPGGAAFNGDQIAVAGDDSTLALADATGGCMRLDPATLTVQSTLLRSTDGGFTTSVAVGAGGSVACGGFSNTATDTMLGIYGSSNAAIATYPLGTYFGLGRAIMAATSDGLVAVNVTPINGTSPALVFAPMTAAH